MNKKEIRQLLKDLKAVNILSKEDFKSLSETLKPIIREDDLKLFEAELSELAVSELQLEKELEYLALIIKESTSSQFTEIEVIDALKNARSIEGNPFKIFKLVSFDVFKYRDFFTNSTSLLASRMRYHAVVGIEYNNTKYTFGFTKRPKEVSISYTINDSGIRWINIPDEEATQVGTIPLIVSMLKGILEI